MKKIILIIMSFLFVDVVYASTSSIEISSIELLEKSDSTIEVNEASFENLNLNLDLKFKEVNDFAKYKIVLKNNESKDFTLDLEDSNDKYISFTYDYDNKVTSNGQTNIILTVKYNNEVNNNDLEYGKYKVNGNIKFALDEKEIKVDIENPKTYDSFPIYYLLLVVSLVAILVLVKVRYKISNKYFGILLTLCIVLPNAVLAKMSFILNTTINIEVDKYDDINLNNVDDEEEEKYSVIFNVLDHGTLNGESTFSNILTGLTYEDVNVVAPTVTANEGYKFVGWDKEINKTVTSNQVYNAKYIKDLNDNNIDDDTELVSITFNALDHGTINGESTFTVNNLLPGYDKYPAAPEVITSCSYGFDSWDNEYNENEIIPLNNAILEFNATYERLYEIVNDLNNNNIADVGDEISVGTEHFHVISNNNDKIVALAKYNLELNNTCTSLSSSSCTLIENPSGIQDENSLGFKEGLSVYSRGTSYFSNSNGWGNGGVDLDIKQYDGPVKDALYGANGYEKYVQQTISAATVRLVTLHELENLIGSTITPNYNIKNALGEGVFDWIYTTSYWTSTTNNGINLYTVHSKGSIGQDSYKFYISYFGIRPVIEIPIN